MKIKILIIILFSLFIVGCQDDICGDGICSEDETLDNCKSDCEIKIDDLDFPTNNSAVFNSITGNAIYQKDRCSVHSCNNCNRNDLCNKLKNLLLSYYQANNTLNNINNKLIKYPDSASKEILVNEIELTQTKINNFFSYYYPINLDDLTPEQISKGKLDVSNIDKELESIKNKIISFITHGTLCGNKICDSGETNSDKNKQGSSLDENIKTLPKDCGCPPSDTPVCGVDEKTYSNECWAKCHDAEIDYKGECVSKFGTHAGSQNMTENNLLKSSVRIMPKYSFLNLWGTQEFIEKLDKIYLDNKYGIVVSLISDKERKNHNYYLLDEDSLNYWKKIVYRIVERYDGDSDFGSIIDNNIDCYETGDNLYPKKNLRDKIMTRPIKHWQIENEWTWQIYDKETNKKANVKDLVTHMAKISSEIKKADPDSKILMSGFSGLQTSLLHQQKEGFIERGTPDCNYKHTHYDDLTSDEKKLVKQEYDKTLYLIKNAADYYDIIDFHFYGNNPEVLVNVTNFLNNILEENGITDKEYWSLEAASPFYFFNLISTPHIQVVPTCRENICETGYYETNYDEKIHSEHLIKMYMFGLSSGIKKIFYSSLMPTCNWDENYARLSLMDLDGNKKLAYYTYKLMTDKLYGYKSLERVNFNNNNNNNDDDYIYEAKIDNKSVFIAWTKSNNHSIDMTDYLQGDVKITTLLIDDKSKKSITKVTSSSDIQISNSPIFIEDYKTLEIPGNRFGAFPIFDNKGELKSAEQLGLQKSRVVLSWDRFEPEQDNFNFNFSDSFVNMSYEAGIMPVVTIKSDSSWGTRGGFAVEAASPPLDWEDYEDFVRTLVNRYKDKVKYWQIENEVYEYNTYWNGSTQEYIELLQNAYTTIKEVDPDSKVVLQGFSNGMLKEINNNKTDKINFFNNIMSEGDYFDVIDFHQYEEYDTVYMEIDILKNAMKTHGYNKTIICTEAGGLDLNLFRQRNSSIVEKLRLIPAVSDKIEELLEGGLDEQDVIDFGIFLKKNTQSRPILEKYQAENLVKRMSITLSQGVEFINWFVMVDAKKPRIWFFSNMGLMDVDGRKKPHFYTYKLLIEKLEGFEDVKEISFGSSKVIEFSFSDKNSIYVLWNDKGSKTLDLTPYISEKNVQVSHIITELDSNNNPIYPKDQIVSSNSIPLSETPIFIEEIIKDYPINCTCNTKYAPVCGVDGKTYTNECWAKCDEVEVDYKGECVSKFGMHGHYGKTDHTNNLRSSTRSMFRYNNFENITNYINKFDNGYLNNNYGAVISFVSDKERKDHTYYLLDENSLNKWKKIVHHVVERYDGDSDFGCIIDDNKDCYETGDELYPSKELRDKILKRPIKHWQIENEWLWQIYDKETKDKADVEDLVTHMAKISHEIKKADPDSKIIMGGFTGVGIILLYLEKEEFIEKGTPDCKYEKKYYENLTPLEIQSVEEVYNKSIYLIKNAADYYDIIDFHFYENEPKLLVSFTEFLDDILEENGITDKEYWSLEAASPFYFFTHISPRTQNVPPCKYDICENNYYDTIYDENIHSEHLIKMYVYGLSSGIKKIFYSTLMPTCSWSENFVRLSLVDIDGNKKLPYYTYKLMTDKLFGYESLERVYLYNNNNDNNNDDDYIYEAKIDNKSVFVAWTKSNNHSIDMTNYIQGDAKITTLLIDDKSKKSITKVTSSSEIEISNSPIFIEEYKTFCGDGICQDSESVRTCSEDCFIPGDVPVCSGSIC